MNSDIVDITKFTPERKRYVFKVVQVPIIGTDTERLIPCIQLCYADSGICAVVPGYERWYLDLSRSGFKSSETLKRRAYAICAFLNHMLHETNHQNFWEIDINDMRNFLEWYKKKNDGEERSSLEWKRDIIYVYKFLMFYQMFHKDKKYELDFKNMFMIENPNYTKSYKRSGNYQINQSAYIYNYFGVKEPHPKAKKYRMLPESYMDIMLMEALVHDPYIALGIALQAYAGLREGEVVNLTRNSMQFIDGGYGIISNIIIDLTKEAPFAVMGDKKTPFGHIKKFRTAEVYNDFIELVFRLRNNHDKLLDDMGITEINENTPLFVNRSGKPMNVSTYKSRVKKLFYDYFLPALIDKSEQEDKWAQNAPYIEQYKKEYPGAHMFRHWFTMYLIKHLPVTKNQDIIDLVASWRGDADRTSMEQYIHVNADVIRIYQECAFAVQTNLLNMI